MDDSPAPGTPQTGTKAYVATALSAAAVFAGIWIKDTDPFTMKEAVQAVLTALVASGVVGIPTYYTRNKAK
jgi:predicted TIM-barrel enzyme